MDKDVDVLVSGLAFAEGLRYAEGRIWFSDMYARQVYTVDACTGETTRVVETPDRPSGIVLTGDGRAFVTQQETRSVVEIAVDGTVVQHADLSAIAEWHVNDMTKGPAGGLYVGNYGDDSAPPEPPHPAKLCYIHADGRVRAAASDLFFANGMEMNSELDTLFVAETRSTPPRISCFDVAPDGSLHNRRVFAEFDGARMPDGIAVLPNGEVLVAMPFSSEVVLVSPAGDIAKVWSTSSIGMPFAVAANPEADEIYVACSSSWEEGPCLKARDSTIVRLPLRSPSAERGNSEPLDHN